MIRTAAALLLTAALRAADPALDALRAQGFDPAADGGWTASGWVAVALPAGEDQTIFRHAALQRLAVLAVRARQPMHTAHLRDWTPLVDRIAWRLQARDVPAPAGRLAIIAAVAPGPTLARALLDAGHPAEALAVAAPWETAIRAAARSAAGAAPALVALRRLDGSLDAVIAYAAASDADDAAIARLVADGFARLPPAWRPWAGLLGLAAPAAADPLVELATGFAAPCPAGADSAGAWHSLATGDGPAVQRIIAGRRALALGSTDARQALAAALDDAGLGGLAARTRGD